MKAEKCVSCRTHLYVSGEREVLPEGVTLEAIVCQNTPQVWVVGKEHAIHVPYLQKNKHIHLAGLSMSKINAVMTPEIVTHLPLVPVGSHVD